MAAQANRRPRTSKRWERQNANAAATAAAAPQTSAYPKSNSACSLHSTGAAGKRDMQRLLVDCSTLPNESFVVWQHFWSTNIADRLALHRPVATPLYRKQLLLQARTMRIFCRRYTARICSAASRQACPAPPLWHKKRTCTGCRFFCAKYSEANLRNNVCLLYIILNFCVPYVWSAHRLHCRTFILPLYPARLSPALSTAD